MMSRTLVRQGLSVQTPAPVLTLPCSGIAAKESVVMTLIAEPIAPVTQTLERRGQVPAAQALDLAHVDGLPARDKVPGGDLDPAELLELAGSIAADASRWQGHVAFSDDQRHYISLYRDTHVDVWVLCWTPQNDTGWHDHDISSGAIAVTGGCLTEHNLAVGVPSLSTDVPEGLVFAFGPDHIHRLTGRDPGSVSIHVYSPPLWRMG